MNPNLHEKLYNRNKPKRILALDGGGVRGSLTLGMLKKIETLARGQAGNPNLVLGDYYDLIGGTSTGAIIACCLAIGLSVDEIIGLYRNLGKEVFGKGRTFKIFNRGAKTIRALLKENYSSDGLEKYLIANFKQIHLGDDQNIKCGLALNSKRADTYSLWTVANHPEGKYYNANGHLKLWEICRASSAAPYYFSPKKLSLRTRKGESLDGTFIDGGVSLANNPAWQTFLVAVVPSFGFKWNPGKDNMFITTLGTGNGQTKEDPTSLEKLRGVQWAPKLSDLFMVDALEMNQIILEGFGNNVGRKYNVDSQFENLNELKLVPEANKLFTFDRHNITLTEKGLKEVGVDYTKNNIDDLKEMDHFENIDDLLAIGTDYAEKNITSIL